MITLLKKDSDIMAVRDICVETREGRILLPKGWQGWLYAITKENGEPELFVQGKDPRSGETETYYYLDPRDFAPTGEHGLVKFLSTKHISLTR